MKKIAILVFAFCILTLISIYFSIPENIKVSKVVTINCTKEGATRFLSDKNNWKKLWPGGNYNPSTDQVIYKHDTIQILNRLRNSIDVLFHYHHSLVPGTIEILPLSADSTTMGWHCTITTGLNPIKRIERFQEARHIKRIMTYIMETMKSFLEKKENVYGITIEKISTKDTFLVATRSIYSMYPGTSDVYSLVDNLKKYIVNQQAQETGSPIMNITQLSGTQYELMVAVPTNKELPEEGQIFFRRMVPGNFMSTEVKGGDHTVKNALNKLQLYMEDYKKTILAIPFQALITDRNKEVDTSKWITRIYYPSI